MILMSEDVYKYAKRKYARYCIIILILGVSIYDLRKKLAKQEKVITDLTKRVNKIEQP